MPRADACSVFTVVIYLNDEHSDCALLGGETQFLRERDDNDGNVCASSCRCVVQCSFTSLSFCISAATAHPAAGAIARSIDRSRYDVLCSVTPRAGSALVFRHELLHEAAAVVSGLKYEQCFARCRLLAVYSCELFVCSDTFFAPS